MIMTGTMTSGTDQRTMYYGKGDVWVYRSYAKPLRGLGQIPESAFAGRPNVIFGMNVQMAVEGEAFLPSFTEGDNSMVVATDSMKNFILRQAGAFEGATAEGFLEFVAGKFLEKYAHVSGVRLFGRQIPFDELPVPEQEGFRPGELVFRYSMNEYPTAFVAVRRGPEGPVVVEHAGGVAGLKLIKIKGSSFYGYIHDEYTTLPEAQDRPLFIYLYIKWKYEHPEDFRAEHPERYVAAEQVRDIAHTVFHELTSPSIQNLIYHIGRRVLTRFPQLLEVSFEANNRTWETVLEEVEDLAGKRAEAKVYTEPRPPYGFQGFTVTRKDLEE
ncbi:factor-independent urate hydroxylase [Kyrpidia tusciae]|uniref:Uricase n=1 Tax=Kyrpidia tusciae (strain DSM 2912 / NBRC 15312 / T2) TaxID=562970 RepID=D5WQV0_KYRT2|nr:urate oxidase [Kyrpidia tusciae]ADG06709.1 urate oxidase [Kyrpidia tusciae DSM 2912]